MKALPLILVGGAAIAAIALSKKKNLSAKQMRAALIRLDESEHPGQGTNGPFSKMTDSEIEDCYKLVFIYLDLPGQGKNKKPVPEDLKARIAVISRKYNIFT